MEWHKQQNFIREFNAMLTSFGFKENELLAKRIHAVVFFLAILAGVILSVKIILSVLPNIVSKDTPIILGPKFSEIKTLKAHPEKIVENIINLNNAGILSPLFEKVSKGKRITLILNAAPIYDTSEATLPTEYTYSESNKYIFDTLGNKVKNITIGERSFQVTLYYVVGDDYTFGIAEN